MRWWAIAAMAGLAGLDLASALLAKELSARPRVWMYALAIGWSLDQTTKDDGERR